MKKFFKDESGATAIEYGLIAAAMGLMLVISAPILSDAIDRIFGLLGDKLDTYNG
jgi:pilus assembly protein Flp/PilA